MNSYTQFLSNKLGDTTIAKHTGVNQGNSLSFNQVNSKLRKDKKWTAKTEKVNDDAIFCDYFT